MVSIKLQQFGDDYKVPFLDDEGTQWWMDRLRGLPHVEVREIGLSRAGRTLCGLKVGRGPRSRSIVAGAHADEPSGPVAACVFAEKHAYLNWDNYTYYIVPQVNPDGAEANKAWFAPVPDLDTYLRHVKREGPGDDIEFGYPGDGRPSLRPENAAVAEFLSEGAPFEYHASLHSMGFAEGAWFLIGNEWAGDRTHTLRHWLRDIGAELGFRLHDIERKGEKGFNRICKGFCTTPTGVTMREHFANDRETARLFHLSSMEYVQSLGGDPLLMVSELPVFALEGGWTEIEEGKQWKVTDPLVKGRRLGPLDVPAPLPGETRYEKMRAAMQARLEALDVPGALEVAREHGVHPVPFDLQIFMQLQMLTAMGLTVDNERMMRG